MANFEKRITKEGKTVVRVRVRCNAFIVLVRVLGQVRFLIRVLALLMVLVSADVHIL